MESKNKISFKEKIEQMKLNIVRKAKDKKYRVHFLIMMAIVLGTGLVGSVIVARRTTVNDIFIRYTEVVAEELDTEGYQEETTLPEETTVPEETTAEATTESALPSYLPQVQIKSTIISTNHRPWILSDLSDMFRILI